MSSAVPPPPPGSGRRWERRATRASDLLLRTLYITTALFGLLVTPPMAILLVVPAIALGSAMLLVGFTCYVQQRWPSRRTLTVTAGATAALVPFGSGVEALQGLGDAIGVLVLALLTAVGTSRITYLANHATRPAPRRATAAADRSLRELLQVMPLESLCAEWRALQDPPTSRPAQSDRDAAVQARTLLLDEMQRRDAAGFTTWLATGATTAPEEHLRDDRGRRYVGRSDGLRGRRSRPPVARRGTRRPA